MTIAQAPSIATASFPEGRDEDLLTIGEAAAIVRLPLSTMRYHRQLGTGPRFFKMGRYVMTTIGDLREWIEEQKRKAQTGPR